MRIGLMGGTYNPFHIGHLETALEVKRRACIDRLLIIPSNISPHKNDQKAIVSPFHRYAMAVLGTIEEKHLEVSPLEIEAGGISYTYRTIEALSKILKDDDELFYITGVESFEKIATWKKWQKLVDSVDFIVNTRAGYNTSDILKSIPENLTERCIFVKNKNIPSASRTAKKMICIIETKKIDISSSSIRKKMAKGESIKGLVHPFVERYILSNNLYKEDN